MISCKLSKGTHSAFFAESSCPSLLLNPTTEKTHTQQTPLCIVTDADLLVACPLPSLIHINNRLQIHPVQRPHLKEPNYTKKHLHPLCTFLYTHRQPACQPKAPKAPVQAGSHPKVKTHRGCVTIPIPHLHRQPVNERHNMCLPSLKNLNQFWDTSNAHNAEACNQRKQLGTIHVHGAQ